MNRLLESLKMLLECTTGEGQFKVNEGDWIPSTKENIQKEIDKLEE